MSIRQKLKDIILGQYLLSDEDAQVEDSNRLFNQLQEAEASLPKRRKPSPAQLRSAVETDNSLLETYCDEIATLKAEVQEAQARLDALRETVALIAGCSEPIASIVAEAALTADNQAAEAGQRIASLKAKADLARNAATDKAGKLPPAQRPALGSP